MSQQWKIIVIGSWSQQLAWYGWMAKAKVNPFHTAATKPQPSTNKRQSHPRTGVLYCKSQVSLLMLFTAAFTHWMHTYILLPEGSGKWRRVHRTTVVGISEVYSCLCFHAKETLWQFVHLYVPTTRCKSRIAILGIPLQWSCLMRGVVFLASPRQSPPPTASRCWTGSGHVNVEGTKQRHPALLVQHGSQRRAPLHPTDWNLYTALKNAVRLPVHTNTQHVRGVTIIITSSSAFLTLCTDGHVTVSKIIWMRESTKNVTFTCCVHK